MNRILDISFGSGFLSGALGSLGGSAFRSVGGDFAKSFWGVATFSALAGGVGSKLGGGSFWQGALTGATIGALNHGMHNVADYLFPKGYNINKAVKKLEEKAYPCSQSKCATNIRLSIEAGLKETNGKLHGHPRLAKEYAEFLSIKEFNEIDLTNYNPEKGDIMVIEPYKGGNPAGHIQMYNGKQWISDFFQRTLYPGPGYREFQPSYKIFR